MAAARQGRVLVDVLDELTPPTDDGDCRVKQLALPSPAGWTEDDGDRTAAAAIGSPPVAAGLMPLTFNRRGGAAAPPGTIRYVADVIALLVLDATGCNNASTIVRLPPRDSGAVFAKLPSTCSSSCRTAAAHSRASDGSVRALNREHYERKLSVTSATKDDVVVDDIDQV